jgi:phenylacetate-coenzyme A ligase PaaK-like adenylate-forming protein
MAKPIIIRQWEFSPEYLARSLKALDTALNQVSIYKSWKSLDPGPVYPVDTRFAALPALTKQVIRENFPEGMMLADRDIKEGIARGEIQLVETAGTTDDKVTNIWNQQWWDASERASWKLNSIMEKIATGQHREAILVNPKNVGIKSDEVDLPLEKRRLDRYLYLNEKTDPVKWSNSVMDRMIRELNTFQPEVLEANPAYLARLCRYITTSGQKVFQPGAIVFTYEYPTNFYCRQTQKVFKNVPQVSSYGTTETGYVFMECEKGNLHQNSEYCRVDFQRLKAEHGGPRLGRILVTPLNNPWSYLVRFDTGDIVLLEKSEKCSCGRNSGLILSAVAGRKVNLTLTCSGRLVTLLELDDTMYSLAGVDMYQLIQTRPGSYEVHLVSRRAETDVLKSETVSVLKKLYGEEAEISVVMDADIAPEGSGKYLVSKTLFSIDFENYLDNENSIGTTKNEVSN